MRYYFINFLQSIRLIIIIIIIIIIICIYNRHVAVSIPGGVIGIFH